MADSIGGLAGERVVKRKHKNPLIKHRGCLRRLAEQYTMSWSAPLARCRESSALSRPFLLYRLRTSRVAGSERAENGNTHDHDSTGRDRQGMKASTFWD